MGDFFWHIDRAFLDLVERPLIVICIVCAVLIVCAAGLTIHSRRNDDDA